jgi:hypothetical protein
MFFKLLRNEKAQASKDSSVATESGISPGGRRRKLGIKAEVNTETRLKDYYTLKWLKTRYANKITQEYLFNDSER